jgi:ribosomal protein L11 methylase PrmA
VDFETEAFAELERNSELNCQSERKNVQAVQLSLLKIPAPIVISNMFLHELQRVRLDLVRLTIPGGTLICSGLLGEQEYDLSNSLNALGFEFCSSLERDNCQVLVYTSRKQT